MTPPGIELYNNYLNLSLN